MTDATATETEQVEASCVRVGDVLDFYGDPYRVAHVSTSIKRDTVAIRFSGGVNQGDPYHYHLSTLLTRRRDGSASEEITSPFATTPARMTYLIRTNHRLAKFLRRAERYGWTFRPSAVAADTIIVSVAPEESDRDHFVLYPRGKGRGSTLSVYDGRRDHEFSPIPQRTALAFMLEERHDATEASDV